MSIVQQVVDLAAATFDAKQQAMLMGLQDNLMIYGTFYLGKLRVTGLRFI